MSRFRVVAACLVSAILCNLLFARDGAAQTPRADIFEQTRALQARGEHEAAREIVMAGLTPTRIAELDNTTLHETYLLAWGLLQEIEDLAASRDLDQMIMLVFEQRGDSDLALDARLRLAEDLIWLDQLDLAETVASTALERARAASPPNETIIYGARLKLIVIAYSREDTEAAAQDIALLIDGARQTAGLPWEAKAEGCSWAASIYRDKAALLDDWKPDAQRSVDYAQCAVDEIRQNGNVDSTDFAVALETLSRNLARAERKGEAIKPLREAASIMQRKNLRQTRDYIIMISYLADYLRETGHLSEALVWGSEAVDLGEQAFLRALGSERGLTRRERIGLAFAASNFLSALTQARGGVDGLSRDEENHLFRLAQLISTSSMSETLNRISLIEQDDVAGMRNLLAAIRSDRAALAQLEEKRIELASLDVPDRAVLEAIETRTAETLTRLGKNLTLRDNTAPEMRSYRPEATVSIEDVQNALARDEAYITFVTLYGDLHVIAVTDTDFFWHTVSFSEESEGDLCDFVSRMRNSLSGSDPVTCGRRGASQGIPAPGASEAFDPSDAYRTYEKIFGPVDTVLSEKSHWLITPVGDLTALPFSALVTEPPVARADGVWDFAALRWLGTKRSLLMVPSATSLALIRAEKVGSTRAFTGALAISGAPCIGRFVGTECRHIMAETSKNRREIQDMNYRNSAAETASYAFPSDLPGLPGAYAELAFAAERFGPVVVDLRADDFTLSNLTAADWSQANVAIFSTHAVGVGEFGLEESALVVSPPSADRSDSDPSQSLLTASQIASLDMPLDWVLLFGCNTVSPGGTTREHMFSGLSLAFARAGVRSMLITQFEVSDDVSSVLLPELLREPRLGEDTRKSDRLRSALSALLADPAATRFHHPSNWASFAVISVE